MYIAHLRFREPDKHGRHSYTRENENFSKLLQVAEEMVAEYKGTPIESLDIINSAKPLNNGCYQGFVVASLRTVR